MTPETNGGAAARMMTWVFGLFFGLAGIPLCLALPRIWPGFVEAPHLTPFAVGAVIGVAATIFVLKKLPMLPVLEHELTHLAVALLLFRQPLALNAAKEGGEVVYTGRSAFLIRLAPYVLPTATLLLLAFSPIVAGPHQGPFRGLIGATWGYHVTTAFHETRPHQPDLKTGGRVPSFLAVFGLGTLLYAGTALWAAQDFELCRKWAVLAWEAAQRLAALVL